jgi:hypothetical protein
MASEQELVFKKFIEEDPTVTKKIDGLTAPQTSTLCRWWQELPSYVHTGVEMVVGGLIGVTVTMPALKEAIWLDTYASTSNLQSGALTNTLICTAFGVAISWGFNYLRNSDKIELSS